MRATRSRKILKWIKNKDMSLNKKDLEQIKGVVRETMTETMVSEPIKKILKNTVLEVMEPMMIVSQKEFTNIGERFEKVDERFEKIDQRFKKIDERFDKVDERFEKVEEEIKIKFDKVLTGQDKILKELVDLRTENMVNANLYQRHDEKLENHEKRIIIVERKLNIAAVK